MIANFVRLFALTPLFSGILARYVSINMNLAMTVSEDKQQLSQEMVNICMQETQISLEELGKFQNHDFPNASSSSSSTPMGAQCFAHCMYEQMGVLREGVFVENDIVAEVSSALDPKTYIVAPECREIRGENKCETAYKIYQCQHQHDVQGIGKD